MSLTDIGNIALLVSAVAYVALALGIFFLVPWYRSDVGRSLMSSKALLAALFSMAAWVSLADLPRTHPVFACIRLMLFGIAPIVAVTQFYTLLIKHQILSRRRAKAKEGNGRAEEGSGQRGGSPRSL